MYVLSPWTVCALARVSLGPLQHLETPVDTRHISTYQNTQYCGALHKHTRTYTSLSYFQQKVC